MHGSRKIFVLKLNLTSAITKPYVVISHVRSHAKQQTFVAQIRTAHSPSLSIASFDRSAEFWSNPGATAGDSLTMSRCADDRHPED